MRPFLPALAVCIVGVTPVLSGGGTVTSPEPGPPALTSEATTGMLDAMGMQPATTRTVEVVEYVAPPRRAVTYAAPPRQAAKDEPKKTPDPEKDTEVAAAEPPTPREAVRQCTTCHGLDGLAKIPTAPNMAGSSRAYLETQLKAFRSGRREHEVMSVIAEALSDAEITAAAKWYSAIKVTVEIPE